MKNDTRIPRTIHYIWVGGNPKPDSVNKYIETWKKYCPDYEIKEWNEKNYDRITIMAKKGKKEEWKQKAKDNGFSSLNSYLIDCIENKI